MFSKYLITSPTSVTSLQQHNIFGIRNIRKKIQDENNTTAKKHQDKDNANKKKIYSKYFQYSHIT